MIMLRVVVVDSSKEAFVVGRVSVAEDVREFNPSFVPELFGFFLKASTRRRGGYERVGR